MPEWSNWLRLPYLQAAEAEDIYGADGRIAEVQVRCRSIGGPFLPHPPCCLERDLVRNGTKVLVVRDRRIEPAPTWLHISRQRFKCRQCGRTTYEILPDVDETHAITRRLRDDIAKSAVKRPFRDAASFHAVEHNLVRRVFLAYAKDRLANYEIALPRVLGVDENRILSGDRFVCMDIEGGKLLDFLKTRDVKTVSAYFAKASNHDVVEVFVQDMWRGYATVARRLFTKAIVVIDRFHVVRYANDAMDAARIAFQASLSNDDRRKLKRRNRLFLSRFGNMSDARQDRLIADVQEFPFLGAAYGYKEQFFNLYEHDSRAKAEAAYKLWRDEMPKELRPFFKQVLTMMSNWGGLIFNYYEARYTSGTVERMNRSIDAINAAGSGYDFDTLRAKALLRYGNIIPLGDLVNFDLMSVAPEDRQELLGRPVVRGFDPSTLDKALRAGRF
jgi:transposase